MNIPAGFVDRNVIITLRNVMQGPKGVGFMMLMEEDGGFPTLVSQDEVTAVLRFRTKSVLGPPGDYATAKETIQAVGLASSITQVPAGTHLRGLMNS